MTHPSDEHTDHLTAPQPGTPGPDPSTGAPNDLDAGTAADLAADLASEFRSVAVDPRMRRFARAMADLGMPVPGEWASSDDGRTVEFAPLGWDTFDHLVRLVEDLAAHRPVQVVVAPSGPTLFDPGAASGPTAPAVGGGLHIVVPV